MNENNQSIQQPFAATGRIFDIQRFSVHDGPGIRTTVFMKGCPLRCRWCHNPEGLHPQQQLKYNADECIGCKRCMPRTQLSDAERCPTGALSVCGQDVTAQELLSILMRDAPFYGSDGGVTFSGGECLLQSAFVAQMITLLHEHRISVAIDTCGAVPFSSVEQVLDAELFLYDIKCFDATKHKLYTGVDNALIQENLLRLSNAGARLWIRIPVIPDFNDTKEEMGQIGSFLSAIKGVERVTLMPYHTLGKSKYPTLGLTCSYDTDKRISNEELNMYRTLLASYGLNVD